VILFRIVADMDTYAGYNGSIVFLAVIHCDWLIIGSSTEDTTIVVDSGCHEFLSIRRVGKVGRSGGIWRYNELLCALQILGICLRACRLCSLAMSSQCNQVVYGSCWCAYSATRPRDALSGNPCTNNLYEVG
jgi:hypothetical protein